MAKSTSRRSLTVTALTALATTACLGGMALVVRHEASLQATSLEHAARTQLANWRQRDCSRRPAVGEAVPGNAFVAYARAAQLARGVQPADAQLGAMLLRRPSARTPLPDADATATLRDQSAEALVELERGARCLDARPQTDPTAGFSAHTQDLASLRRLVNLAGIEAHARAAEGDRAGAVQVALAAATLGTDLLRSPSLIDQMIGAAQRTIVTTQILDETTLGQLDRSALHTLAEGLERLESMSPAGLDLDGELLLLSQELVRPDSRLLQDSRFSWTVALRYGCSTQWMLSAGYERMEALARELRSGLGQPWPQQQQLLAHLAALAQQHPLTAIAAVNFESAERTLRGELTQLRLLRMAVAEHLGFAMTPLADPFGSGPLQRTAGSDGVRMSSAESTPSRRLERTVARG